MHELSIAMSIVELAEEEARKAGASSISKIEVEIGTLAGVETDALQFAWDAAVNGTAAQNASLEIHSIQAEANCKDCNNDFPVDNYYAACPACGSFRFNLTRGKELRVKSLLVD